MKHVLIAFLLALPAACQSVPEAAVPAIIAPENEAAAIRNVLMTQKDAWNRGDIDAFMEGYWRSPELRFASGGTVTTGWQRTRDRYHANYSDREKMGTLDFTDLEVNQVSPDAAIVHGRWKLIRASDAPHGLFTLLFRKQDGRWMIVSDTTTSGGS